MNFIIGIIFGWATRGCVNNHNENCTITKPATRPRPKPPVTQKIREDLHFPK